MDPRSMYWQQIRTKFVSSSLRNPVLHCYSTCQREKSTAGASVPLTHSCLHVCRWHATCSYAQIWTNLCTCVSLCLPGATPWWLIFVYFLGSLVICFLVMLLSLYSSFWCYKTVKSTLCPPDQLPPHLKKVSSYSPLQTPHTCLIRAGCV